MPSPHDSPNRDRFGWLAGGERECSVLLQITFTAASRSTGGTSKKKATFQVLPAILAFSILFALIFGLSIVSADINCGIKIATGIDLAGPFQSWLGLPSTALYCE